MNPDELKNLIVQVLEDKLAKDITILPVADRTVLADYFVICTGRSRPQLRDLFESVKEKLEEQGAELLRVDGTADSKWIVLDYGSVIVHIFNDETRMFYCLEKLWSERRHDGEDDDK